MYNLHIEASYFSLRIRICAAYLLRRVRFFGCLIETVEPSSCPAAICWDCFT